MSDQQLIAAIRDDSNLLAFKELVQRYEIRIAAAVHGMLGTVPEADDIGQEVFIRFYKNIGNFRGDSSLITYLTRIAINLSLNEIKRRKRRKMVFTNRTIDEVSETLQGDNDNSAEKKERDAIVQQAIRKLDSKHRPVVVLRLIEGHSTEQTAKILNIPTGTVLSRLARAQKKLKILLEPYREELA